MMAALQSELVSPKGTQEREEYLQNLTAIRTAATPYGELQGSSRVWKTQDTGPRYLRCI